MKIVCNQEEANILIRNCKTEQCEFCFLKEVCSDTGRGNVISHILEIKKNVEAEA